MHATCMERRRSGNRKGYGQNQAQVKKNTVHGPKLTKKQAGHAVEVEPLVGLTTAPAFAVEPHDDVLAGRHRDVGGTGEVALAVPSRVAHGAAAIKRAVGVDDARVGEHGPVVEAPNWPQHPTRRGPTAPDPQGPDSTRPAGARQHRPTRTNETTSSSGSASETQRRGTGMAVLTEASSDKASGVRQG